MLIYAIIGINILLLGLLLQSIFKKRNAEEIDYKHAVKMLFGNKHADKP